MNSPIMHWATAFTKNRRIRRTRSQHRDIPKVASYLAGATGPTFCKSISANNRSLVDNITECSRPTLPLWGTSVFATTVLHIYFTRRQERATCATDRASNEPRLRLRTLCMATGELHPKLVCWTGVWSRFRKSSTRYLVQSMKLPSCNTVLCWTITY